MERRTFVQSTLVGLALVNSPFGTRGVAQANRGQQSGGILVRGGKDRFDEPYALGVGHMECKVSGRDTSGAFALFEALTHKEDRPVRHLHHEQDEWFYVMAGEYEMHVGDDVFHLAPGDSVFAPRKVPHVWGCVSEPPGRIMAVLQPAGTIEEFFRELPRYIARNASLQELAELNRRHGMEVLGPRLPI
jgi:mannose-6-phosphate isomerase-like protein (cupin superfamily)